jgi:1,4-dihydroxy-2-naphthoate octaprenyltransferase
MTMLKESTILHLRFPFSFFLMPIFFFALSQSMTLDTTNMILSYVILHLFVYPASNGFNSYYDKDEESIGALEEPPPVSEELLFVSLMMDAVALVFAAVIGWQFTIMVFIYGMISKAYSHPAVRLKKYPMGGWLTAIIFQGAYTYFMVYMAINDLKVTEIFTPDILFPATISTVLLGGFYPITQIYQHNEDKKRGDKTLSLLLGIQNTFLFAGMMFLIADLGFLFYFVSYFSIFPFLILQIFLLPVLYFFIKWFRKSLQDVDEVNFQNTMRMNLIASSSLIAYFIFFIIYF